MKEMTTQRHDAAIGRIQRFSTTDAEGTAHAIRDRQGGDMPPLQSSESRSSAVSPFAPFATLEPAGVKGTQ